MSHEHGSHGGDQSLEQMDDPEPGSTWVVSIGGTVVFIALVLALAALYFQVDSAVVREVQIDAPFHSMAQAKQKQLELLAQTVRYDEKGADEKVTERIRITIDRAKDIMAAELASRPQAAAGGPATEKK